MKKIIFILILAAFCPLPCVLAGEMMYPEGLKRYNDGAKAQKAGNGERAVSEYKMAMLIVGDDAFEFKKLIANNLGVLHAQSGRYDEAEKSFKEAIGIDPQYKKAVYNLGLMYFRQGETGRALKTWSILFDFPQEFSIEGPKELDERQ